MSNPCLGCGACCAFFRVSFHWREADDSDGGVPVALCEDLNSTMRCMRGTGSRTDCRCVALQGVIGGDACCSIHPRRPTPCRDFPASWEDGSHHLDCDRARAAHGLPPLGPEAWQLRPS